MNVHVHRIGLDDLRKLPEYDALFVRALTGVSEPAFQFALRAEALDMPVVDDPQSIIRCGNKVFLEELLRREGIPTPRTLIVTRATPWGQVEALGLPLVLKLPDGSFSSAVHKIASRDEFRRRSQEMFHRSPLIIAQEFLPTDFDWRVTVLGGRLLFAARYYMARGHWQIRSESKGTERYGRVEAVSRGEAPRAVVQLALRAAALIGDGMYGVDLKETPAGPVVIEINDNPNLDVGYEDAGQLTEAVRQRPYSVVLFDEIEKAHPDVFNTLLQILEEGRLTDSQGRSVDFRNTVLIMTSNLGTQDLRKANVGFTTGDSAMSYERMKEKVMDALKLHFRPEFLNRIDEVIVFHELNRAEVLQMVDNLTRRLSAQLEGQGLGIELTQSAKEMLAVKGYDPTLGARPLRRAIQRLVEDPLSEMLLFKQFHAGEIIVVDTEDDPDKPGEKKLKFSAVEGFLPPVAVELAATGAPELPDPTLPSVGPSE